MAEPTMTARDAVASPGQEFEKRRLMGREQFS